MEPLEKAVEEAKTAVEIMEKITGSTEEKEANNFLTSLRLQAWGDALREKNVE